MAFLNRSLSSYIYWCYTMKITSHLSNGANLLYYLETDEYDTSLIYYLLNNDQAQPRRWIMEGWGSRPTSWTWRIHVINTWTHIIFQTLIHHTRIVPTLITSIINPSFLQIVSHSSIGVLNLNIELLFTNLKTLYFYQWAILIIFMEEWHEECCYRAVY